MTNKRGFSSVFLTMIFGSMIMLTFAFIHASSTKAMESSCDAVFSLAGQSILSEFDLTLKEKYGLMAFGLDEKEIKDRLFFYGNSTFKNNRELNMVPVDISSIDIDLKEYSMINVNKFEESIRTFMNYKILNNIVNKDEEDNNLSWEQKDRVLLNKVIIESLPSNGIIGHNIFIQSILDWQIQPLEKIFSRNANGFLVNSYIFDTFNNNKNNKIDKMSSFFKNEVEYIIYGKFSDAENKSKFKSDFIKFRSTLNLVHIYSDSNKVKEINGLANILTPGPAAIATQGVIAAAWAYAEALNDAKLLDNDNKVALIKRQENWAIGIDSYDRIQDGMIKPISDKGYNYEEYLKVFIYLEDREIKLLRIMDLIQINLIGNYNSSFLISDYFSGFKYSVTANDKMINYEKKY
jgi:hypothetical protein